MKVLASAYACAPAWGSEPGAGWYWVRAMAEHNEVWLITPPRWRDDIEKYRNEFPAIGERLHPVYVKAAEWTQGRRPEKRDRHLLHAYLWQAAVAREARRLHREIGFDVAHHITWTVNWLPAGVSEVEGLPFVWGPVSGATGTPRSVYPWLGRRGAVVERIREAVLPLARRAFGTKPLHRAALVLGQSPEVGAWARERTSAPVIVEPVVCVPLFRLPKSAERPASTGGDKRAVFAARFAAWKGLRLAIAGLARPEASGWTLDVYGKGADERPARRLARRLGVTERVRFKGYIPLKELEAAIAEAEAFVHPSMHDAPPFAVAQALSMGTPVICLDFGGPAALVEDGQGIKVSASGDLAAGMGAAYRDVPPRFAPTTRWAVGRLPGFVDECYRRVTGAAAGG